MGTEALYMVKRIVGNEIFIEANQLVETDDEVISYVSGMIRRDAVSMIEANLDSYNIDGKDVFETHMNFDVRVKVNENARGGIAEFDVDVCGQKSIWFVEEVERFED